MPLVDRILLEAFALLRETLIAIFRGQKPVDFGTPWPTYF